MHINMNDFFQKQIRNARTISSPDNMQLKGKNSNTFSSFDMENKLFSNLTNAHHYVVKMFLNCMNRK